MGWALGCSLWPWREIGQLQCLSVGGWVRFGGRGSGINGLTSLSHRRGVSRSRPQECVRWWVCEVEVIGAVSSLTHLDLELRTLHARCQRFLVWTSNWDRVNILYCNVGVNVSQTLSYGGSLSIYRFQLVQEANEPCIVQNSAFRTPVLSPRLTSCPSRGPN